MIVGVMHKEHAHARVLQGMFYEAQGNIEKAVEIYEFGLVDNPTDEDLHKRRVSRTGKVGLRGGRGQKGRAHATLSGVTRVSVNPALVFGWSRRCILCAKI